MTISESQLATWANQGSATSATALYDRIKRALDNDVGLSGRGFEVFLQGSYRNSTNIHGESDVDVVAMLTDTYMPDYCALGTYERQRVEAVASPATYLLTDFRRDVSNAIRKAFPGHQVSEGGKSIKIPRTAYNLPADVVPCLEYRRFRVPEGLRIADPSHFSGIWLWDTHRSEPVISFPKQHYTNGVARHAASAQWYKPTVRIFKNARCWLVDHHEIADDTARSFQIECLLYNVPIDLFGQSYEATFVSILNWLHKADMSEFRCQNGIQPLFGPGRWKIENAKAFVTALTKLYFDWGQANARLRIG